jgi:hypothetical protein
VRKEKGQWTGDDYTLRFNYHNETRSLVSIDKTVQSITPQSGWNAFEDCLTNLKVLTMPDMDAIFQRIAAMDERGVTIEVANPRPIPYLFLLEPGMVSK